ncbi:MAG: thioesterase family protein [Ignavibacteriaceae bacterium]|nr:thioesterase family protein [Ignavibacteriaceae bacterium]
MNRVKIELPDKFIYKTEIPIRISDINYGGHLGNNSVLSILQESRIRFLKQFGYSETNIEGTSIIMTDAVIQYKSQGYYGDVLRIELTVESIIRSGCDFIYKVTNTLPGKEVVRAKTGIVFFNYQKRKTAPVPPEFKMKIEELS